MKNLQIIDGAVNTAYVIFAATEREFRALYPAGTDIEFVEDLLARLGTSRAESILKRLWRRPVDKKTVRGIHGTLFFGLEAKREFYPGKQEQLMIGLPPQFRRVDFASGSGVVGGPRRACLPMTEKVSRRMRRRSTRASTS